MRKETMINLFYGYYEMLCQSMGIKTEPFNSLVGSIAAGYMVLNASLEKSGRDRLRRLKKKE